MPKSWKILCDAPELAAEIRSDADSLGIKVEVELTSDPLKQAIDLLANNRPVSVATHSLPSLEALLSLAKQSHDKQSFSAFALLVQGSSSKAIRELALDLALVAVPTTRALLCAIQLFRTEDPAPWRADIRHLNILDAEHLKPIMHSPKRGGPQLHSEQDFLVEWQNASKTNKVILGRRHECAVAMDAFKQADPFEKDIFAASYQATDIDKQAIRDVLFGPPRALSDPASKAALRPYGLPYGDEEMYTSASRVASEATRIGFPVRIALASPDLRAWDHPDLVANAVDNASRAKEMYQQILAQAQDRAPEARLLGVTVSASHHERALLRVRMSPLADKFVFVQISFADPHGMASEDLTVTFLPAKKDRALKALQRLRGRSLLSDPADPSDPGLQNILNLLEQSACFVNDWREHLQSVEINPVALLLDASIEARELCITVNDSFIKAMDDI
ncbi:MAG: acetate--CoA ligase family protein [Myxococcales bacterium]|nr:MAG: acetate--CoA ligase family protein [Myxococcales bacterium]